MMAYLLLTWWVGSDVRQQDFPEIVLGFGLLFGLYFWVLARAHTPFSWRSWLLTALIARILLVFTMPLLSDDYFRFIWDGRMWINGFHPFACLPSTMAADGFPVSGLDEQLYGKLNSPDNYTVYPPVAQFIFWLSCYVFPEDLGLAVRMMKVVLVLFEAGTLCLMTSLLSRLSMDPARVLMYALNPLVIIEISGNVHFEGVMIFFFLLSYWFILQGRAVAAGVALAASVASKLLSLLALPLFILKASVMTRQKMLYAFTLAMVMGFSMLFSPAILAHFGESLQLYFQRFEFNASVYNLVKGLGWLLSGYNLIVITGPMLGVLAVFIMYRIIRTYAGMPLSELPEAVMLMISVYYLLSTTVHPWYLCFPLALAVFSRYRFVLWWSATVVISYHRYANPGLEENYWLTALSYIPVLGLLMHELLIPMFKKDRTTVGKV